MYGVEFQDVVKFEYDKTIEAIFGGLGRFQDVVKFEYDKTLLKRGL